MTVMRNLIVGLFCSCVLACADASVGDIGQDRMAAAQVADSPVMIRRAATLQTDVAAAALLDKLMTGQAEEPTRVTLARRYRQSNFESLGQFFDQSARLADRKAVVWAPGDHHLWACGDKGESNSRMAGDWHDRIRRGEWISVAAELPTVIETRPNSCILRMAWAEATLLTAEQANTSVSSADRELAVRTWLSLTEEGNILPIGTPDRTSAYMFLAQYFSSMGDFISSLTAYRIARLRAGDGVIGREAATSEIDKRIAVVRAAMRRKSNDR